MLKGFINSVNNAIEGIIYAVRTQRNMKIHLIFAILVLLASIFLPISKLEVILIVIIISIVLISEVVNTIVELMLDLIVDKYHPVARIIKDMAAGTVFISAIMSAFLGYLIFFPYLRSPILRILIYVHKSPGIVAISCILITTLLVIILKAFFARGRPLSGGMPSGHTAVSFAIWTFASMISKNPVIFIIVLIPALLVAQSRVKEKIHSIFEVIAGAILGIAIALFVYWLFSGTPFEIFQ
jgi:diacylglycerol kinase (ATP)